MNLYQVQFNIEATLCNLDMWQGHLEHYSTAFGGEPDDLNVSICEDQISKLNKELESLQALLY
jgi:hypothetical protein